MKNRMAKRLLAGMLAVLMLFGDASGVLASGLPETEEVLIAETSEYTGPIYKVYYGLPSVLTPKLAESPYNNSKWQGDKIISFGVNTGAVSESHNTNTWRILDPAAGLLVSNEIFLKEDDLGEFDSSYDNNYVSNINAILANYAKSEVAEGVTKFSDIEQAAISEIRLLTVDEVTNPAYGYYATTESDNNKAMSAGYESDSYLVDSGEDNNQTWVLRDGRIETYGYLNPYADDMSEDPEEKQQANDYQNFRDETVDRGYVAAIELDLDRVFMTVYNEFYGRWNEYDISGETNRAWKLLLHSNDSGFAAEVPSEIPVGGDIVVNVTNLGNGTYDKISIVLSNADGKIVWYDTATEAAQTGEFLFITDVTNSPFVAGNYTMKVFAENSEEGYVSNVLSSDLEIVSASAYNLRTTQEYGKIKLMWDLKNTNGYYTYCDIYRSGSIDGEYVKITDSPVECRNDSASGWFYYDTVTPAAGEAANPTYYYKVAINGSMSEPGTNAGVYYGTASLGDYIGAYVVDKDKNKVNSLTIHEGEALELGIAFVKKDGSIEYLSNDDLGGAQWYLHKDYGTTENYDNQRGLAADILSVCPYELITGEDGNPVFPTYKVYIRAGDDAEGTYYLTTRIYQEHEGWNYSRYWQIPVTIVAAEEGVDYGQAAAFDIVTTPEEAEQRMRDLMVARDYTSYFLTKDIYSIDMDEVYDLYAERDGMKPYEGDYLFYQAGERNAVSSMYESYKTFSVYFNGDSYTAYQTTTPFITTAAEEQQVNEKINDLIHTQGGALYKYAYGDYTDEQKVKAIYDWIVANVNPQVAGDRRTPIYHTVYHTLYGAYGRYPGSGTCGAFAVLFTRLSREMGIASKVIMGTDSAAHAYNVVKVGNKWYFIDTNSRRYLSDADNFVRAQEQRYYLDDRFIDNYLGKIEGNDYIPDCHGYAVVTDSNGVESEAYYDMRDAVAYVLGRIASDETGTVEYTISVKEDDMALTSAGLVFFGTIKDVYGYEENVYYGDRITLDLGGNTLIVRDGIDATIAVKSVKNGKISVGDDTLLSLYNDTDKQDYIYENVAIIYRSTTGTATKTPMLSFMGGMEHKTVLSDSVTIDTFYDVEIRNNVEINTDVTVKRFIQIQDGSHETDIRTVINGTLTIDGDCYVYAGTHEIEKFVSKKLTSFEAPAQTKLIIGKELNLAGMTAWGNYVGEDYWAEDGSVEVSLKRRFAEAGDTTPYEQATIQWSGSIFNHGLNDTTAPMFHVIAQDYVADVLQENKAFAVGATIGKVTAKGLDKASWKYNVALTTENLEQYITVETAEDGKTFVELENGVLSLVSLSVIVTESATGKSQVFTTLKKAIAGLASVANKAEGTYNFTFAENISVSEDMILPAYVKEAVFTTSDGTDRNLNLNGKTLTVPGKLTISTGNWQIQGTILVKGGTLSVPKDAVLELEEINTVGGTISNSGKLVCDTLVQDSGSKAQLAAGSELFVQTKAELNGIELLTAESAVNPKLCVRTDTEVALNGSLTSSNESLKLVFAILSGENFTDLKEKQKIFTTDMEAFPVERIQLKQASETPIYQILIQKSDSIYVIGSDTVVGEGADLSYVDESGKTIVVHCKDFAAAVAEINNLRVKREYTITLYDDFAVTGALTMPNKAYIETLTMVGAGIEGNAKIRSNGKVGLTSATTLSNLRFENATYTVTIGDYSLTIGAQVEFPNKVALNSSKKGSLIVPEEGRLSNVTTVNVAGLVNEGEVTADTIKITDANLNNGHLYANQMVQIANLTLEGEAIIKSEEDFKITGTLHSKTDKAVFYTRQNTKKVPYLNISGTVTLENPEDKIQVGVYGVADSLNKLPSGSMLLTVKTATIDLFAPVPENVGKVGEYPAENGYFLQKNKTGIYVYDAKDVAAALYKDNAIFGYFTSFASVVSEIETQKNISAEYTIALLADINSSANPAAVTLPSKAEKVTITSGDEEVFDIYYIGNITLKTHTEFEKVCLNPMDKSKKGVASKFAAGKFDLTLCDVEVGNIPGMAIKDIAGSKTQITTLDSEGLVVAGSISGSKELVVSKPVIVNGSVKVTNLMMQGGVSLHVAGAISVTDIYNNKAENNAEIQKNALYYTKSGKGISNLTVNGVISGDNETDLELHYNVTGEKKTDYQLVMNASKFTLDSKRALASMPKAGLSEVSFYLGDTKLGDTEVVKANKGVYVVDVSANSNIVLLNANMDGVLSSSYCLDFVQAVNEINNAGSADTIYEIEIGPLSGTANITDTNTTDSKEVSAITMPKKGKAAAISIISDDGESIAYSGNIAYPGSLTISNVELMPTGPCSISGTKNVSEVRLSHTKAVFKDIKNVKVLSLNAADLKTTGAVTVKDVVMSGVSHWDAFGKTSVTNMDVSESEAGSYIGAMQTAKTLVPMFTINGYVTLDEAGNPVAFKVYQPTATMENPLEVTAYKNIKLVVAPKENADRFVAWSFTKENITTDKNTEDIIAENLVSYKSIKNEVACGDLSEMVIRIVQTHQNVSGEAETYATSFDEAVTIINNLNDKTASYRMELLRGSAESPLLTTKNGTVFGKMSLPSKAAEVTIVGANNSAAVAIAYKGSLTVNCDTVFDNVVLLEENEKNNVSVSYGGAYGLTFTDSVVSEENYAVLTLDSIKASKGTLTLDYATVYVVGAITAKDIAIVGESSLVADGKTTITNVYGSGNNSAKLSLDYAFSTKNATQLTINGNISDVKLELIPYLYEQKSDTYHSATVDTVADKQLVVMPKASITDVTVGACNEEGNFYALAGGNLYKQNGGLYFTTEPLLVEVVAEDALGNVAPQIYSGQFLSWDYAVKEIDKRADNSLTYRMILKDDIGGVTGGKAPIKTLSLPAKAKEVVVTSEAGEENQFFFTGNKVTLKTNTAFENVGLFAVKKVSAENGGQYDTITYNFSTGKCDLTWKDLTYMGPENIWREVGTISGNGKGTFTVVLGNDVLNNAFVVEKISKFATVNIYNEVEDDMVYNNQIVSCGLIRKDLSNIGTLNLYPGTVISCDAGSVTAKNANIYGNELNAKDITISQTVTLESAKLMAGTDVVGDGKLTLGNVIVKDTNNRLEAKLSKQDKTQLSITGTVTAAPYYTGGEGECAIEVALLAKDGSIYMPLVEGMDVINTAKAEAFWFVPWYTHYDEDDQLVEGMGWYKDGFGLYNTQKTIKYGSVGM